MTKRGIWILTSVALSGCASAASTAVPPADPSVEREIVFQWGAPQSIFTVQPRQVIEAQEAQEIILNVATAWTSGRSSLLTPWPRCPGSIIRLDSSGKVTRTAAPVDLAGSRLVPTLKHSCFRGSGG